jgi:hypothetical protein
MVVTFVRTVGAPDRIYVDRGAGGEGRWSFPTYGDELPHDLVHLVVEARFGVRDGIWAAVATGVDLARANAQANRAGGKDKYRGTGLDRPGVLLSETLANAGWRLGDDARIAADLAAAGVDASAGQVAAVRAELDGLRDRWRALAPRGALRFDFDPAAPALRVL